jgi:hypothetical protein
MAATTIADPRKSLERAFLLNPAARHTPNSSTLRELTQGQLAVANASQTPSGIIFPRPPLLLLAKFEPDPSDPPPGTGGTGTR